MTVVYLDSVFVLNTLMDYLLVLCTGRLAGLPLRRKRYLLAALFGGIYAAAVFLPGLGFLAEFPVKLAAGTLMALIAFGGEEKLLRLTLLFYLISCGLAGCVLALGLLAGNNIPMAAGVFYTDVDAKILLIAAAAAYLVLTVVFRASARHGLRGELVAVRLCIAGKSIPLTALLDTGNDLRDPITGDPVLVTARGALDSLFSPEVRRLLNSGTSPTDLLEPLCRIAPELHFHLIPYHAVGLSGGLLLVLRTDWTEVAGERYENLMAALAPNALGTGCTALWGGEIKRRGHHEKLYRTLAGTADPVGTSAGERHSLHLRERHSAAAAPQGARVGTVGPSGSGGRTERTD